MEFLKFKKLIQANPIQPLYFLYGEEPYFIDQLSALIVDLTVDPAMKDFNFSVLYGKEVDFKTMQDQLTRYPMMADYQVVILREAQAMREFDQLISYVSKPQPTTIFIVEYKARIDKRQKVFKELNKLDTAFESKKVRDYEIANWIVDYVKALKGEISIQNAQLIADHLGMDLNKVVNEIQKLYLNIGVGTPITGEAIEKYIGISMDYNIFELQKALGKKDLPRVVKIAQYMAENEKDFPLVMVVSLLFTYFSKIYMLHFLGKASPSEKMKTLGVGNQFFLKEFEYARTQYNLSQCEQALRILQEYDLRSKGIKNPSGENGVLIRELMGKLL